MAEQDDTQGLRVLVADEDEVALREVGALLRSLGHEVTAHAVTLEDAADRIAADEPDLSIVLVCHDDEHALGLIEEIGEYATGPVVALLGGADPSFAGRAAERGVAAFARPDSAADVQAAIEVALTRHAEAARLAERVDQLEGAMERRAVIERAKGILMERHRLNERGAFDLLRDHARATSTKVVAVAVAVTDGHGLLPRATAPREPQLD